ncbi:glycosyltransferase family protein [Thermodesulfobacteriota bacterium]
MARKSTYNILMYSHDTFGLGHIRRTMAIASRLRSAQTNILILTGSPIAGRFAFPDQVDFVRIPGMIKRTNEEYFPLSIKINPKHAMDIRKNIITATAKTFQPNLFIVDKEPLGLKKEVLPVLQWFQRCLPKTRTILGLRDVMDDAATIREDWHKKGVYEALDKLYSEIWVYGIQELYDPIREYDIPDAVGKKIRFTGYIPRKTPSKKSVQSFKREHGLDKADKLVVVTTGGGGDGYPVMDAFLSMLETESGPPPFQCVLITGPFMPRKKRAAVFKRSARLGIRSYRFYRWMEKIQAAADLVVCMGGYNTVCEILSQGTVSLIIPRETPRKEQLIRARILHSQHLVDYIPWNDISPEALRKKVLSLLEAPEPYQEAISQFQLTGFEIMFERLQAFKNKKP